ncbi:MAG: hypothetical protein JWM59_461 [Verrucomicrobiales bacterium]|nr:hypothetical protein [Verrucomicrobiales bacterium]RYD36951.1 MAG: hypothetical protein EOP86_04585 [Verrucomicrobiaceae bacterium]
MSVPASVPTPRPMYGISRIDQPEKKNHGWYVRVTFKGKTEQKFFADKAHGTKPKALKAAQEHRDHLVTLLPPARQEAAARKRAVSKKTVKTSAAAPAPAPEPVKEAPAAKKTAKKAAKKVAKKAAKKAK